MDRLTFEGNFCDISQCREVLGSIFCKDGDCDQRKTWEKLKHFEDLQEQGRLVVLPCKRGDAIYFIKSAFSWAAFPIAAKVVSIRGINCDNEVMYRAITINNKLDKCFTSKNIGKTVFLTRAEAQAALDRLESK